MEDDSHEAGFDIKVEHPEDRSTTSAASQEDVLLPTVSKSQDEGPQNTSMHDEAPLEQDTCRICRSEGTADEPLFHPCKCSGSIRNVHQECLMEWLAHTSKKHCELCKTSFRFTKLYDPHMPAKLPPSIFLRRALVHIGQHVATWSRAILVIIVWLFALPLCIRWAWRGLFFMLDAGWAREPWIARLALAASNQTTWSPPNNPAVIFNLTISDSKSPPITPLPDTTGPTSFIQILFGALGALLWEILVAPWATERTDQLRQQRVDAFLQATNTAASSTLMSAMNLPEVLNENPTLRRAILDMLEGQIITTIVVIIFILIFLIREWVIQQQPLINAQAQVREAQDRLERVEEARQQIDREIKQIEEQLDYLRGQRPSQVPPEPSADAAEEGHSQTNTMECSPAPTTTSAESSREFDWHKFSEQVNNITQQIRSSDTARSEDALAKISRLSSEVLAIIRLAQDNKVSDIEAFEKLLAWVRDIPADVDSVWLSDMAGAFSRLRTPRQIVLDTSTQDGGEWTDEDNSAKGSSSSIQSNPKPSDGEGSDSSKAENSTDDSPAECTGCDEGAATDSIAVVKLEDERSDHNSSENKEAAATEGSWSTIDAFETISFVDSQTGNNVPVANGGSMHAPLTDETGSNFAPASNVASLGEIIDDAVVAPLVIVDNEQDQRQETPRGRLHGVREWLWGDIDYTASTPNPGRPDTPVENAEDVELPGPAVPAAVGPERAVGLDVEVLAAAQDAGIDAQAVEEAEDLEGVLELIGMNGPIVLFFQTALFFGLLVTVTLWAAVGVPYIFGKLVLQLLGDPTLFFIILPLQIAAHAGDVILDLATLLIGGFFTSLLVFLARLSVLNPYLDPYGSPAVVKIANATAYATDHAAQHLIGFFGRETDAAGTNSHFLLASLQSHRSLINLKTWIYEGLSTAVGLIIEVVHTPFTLLLDRLGSSLRYIIDLLWQDAKNDIALVNIVLARLKTGNIFTLTLQTSRKLELDPLLSYWSGGDRAITICIGYMLLAVGGLVYVSRQEPMFSSPSLQKIEKALADVLKQAGGVAKVILIISIEMLMFPLYCGMLLDIALMPLFEGVTLQSRIIYAQNQPYMFVFLHWFLGTAYMFNFALFVSMCRRILRSGVLYFIRDPDDPTFHPVRDVLERNISTQLRKIGFSALVYGLMVIFCMGGIVWAVAGMGHAVFPVRWSTPDPVLEFPLEFLLYNFASPILFKVLQPSMGMESIYDWWLRKCARNLRLSHFLFGVRNIDEEHIKTAPADGPIVRHGSYIKVPASDQVRLSRNSQLFTPVTEAEVDKEDNERDCDHHGKHDSKYRSVYTPPWFRSRIGLFLVGLWMLSATIGASFTIFPLMLGRALLSVLLPAHVRCNDVWSYFLGLHTLLVLGYSLSKFSVLTAPTKLTILTPRFAAAFSKAKEGILRCLRCTYVYGFAFIIVPAVFIILSQLYVLIPLETFLNPGTEDPGLILTKSQSLNVTTPIFTAANATVSPNALLTNTDDVTKLHTIYVLPDWMLGFIVARLTNYLLPTGDTATGTLSFPAAVRRHIFRNGYFNPDASATTRAVVLPVLILTAIAIAFPLGIAKTIITLVPAASTTTSASVTVYRYTYPAILAQVGLIWACFALKRLLGRWQNRIKDEVYLVGEKLHNLGESRPPDGAKSIMIKGKQDAVLGAAVDA